MPIGAVADSEDAPAPRLVGTRDNPARDPKVLHATAGRGSVGDRALITAVAIVAAAWVLLLALAISLRSFNV